MIKNSDLSVESRVIFSNFCSAFLHVLLFIFILYAFNGNEIRREKDNFEIIDAEIIGLIDQTKNEKNHIKEQAIVSVKSEELIKNAEIDKKEKIEKKNDIEKKQTEEEQKEIKEIKEIKEEKPKEEKKEEINLVNKQEEEKNKNEAKKELEKAVEKEVEKIEEKKEDISKQLDRSENKKIDDVIKKIEDKEKEKKELEDLKKSLNKANKILNNIENNDKTIKNSNSKANNIVGGGDQAMARLGSYIKSRFISCWKIPPMIGVEAEKIYVILKISLDEKGTVNLIQVLNKQQYNNNQFFNVISESAIKAVQTCSPVPNLPHDKYEDWREIELVFDPSKFLS